MSAADWISERAKQTEISGIRKMFELGKSLKNPVNLSIGQPDFDVPEPIKRAAIEAIEAGRNGYTTTQGDQALLDKISARVRQQYPDAERKLLVTSGTSGGLLLAIMAVVNPGDEVIVPDPYFVSYPHLVRLAGGVPVFHDTYPNFQIDPEKLESQIGPRTKAVFLCSPANPTGTIASDEVVRAVAEICDRHNLLLISDEIYRQFQFDGESRSAAEFNPNCLVIEGFGKTYGMTGWRLGYAHGPAALIEEMTKLQQFTFVCAPSPLQWAAMEAIDFDTSPIIDNYRKKRDRVVAGLRDRYTLDTNGGAFYLFPKCPWGSGTEFAAEAVRHNLLIIPGSVFSQKDSHFRLSYAAADEMLDRGIDILNRLADRPT